MITDIPFTLTKNSLTFFLDGAPITINSSHLNFESLVEEFKTGKPRENFIRENSSLINVISTQTFGKISILETDSGNVIQYNGKTINNVMSKKLLELIDLGFPITRWALFMDNLMTNPDQVAIDSLYGFLEKYDHPITEDGKFLAFKMVRRDFMDSYSGKIDNSVGKVITMDRDQVNSDPNVTCSHGLHVCSKAYLGCYSGDTTICVKVNPADVCAIPYDYQDSKMRVCEYEVMNVMGETNSQTQDRFEEQLNSQEKVSKKKPKRDKTRFGPSKLTAKQILKKVEKHGSVRGAARNLGVAKTTFQGWVNKSREILS